MAINTDSTSVYTDLNGLEQLKYKLKGDSVDDLRVAAQQFEAIFIQQMLKSMRDASLSEGLFDNNGSDFYVEMLDKQMSLELSSGKGIGLADIIVQQLSNRLNITEDNTVSSERPTNLAPSSHSQAEQASTSPSIDKQQSALQPDQVNSKEFTAEILNTDNIDNLTDPQTFIKSLWPMAVNAAKELGVAPKVLIAQAALETGWGQYVVKDSDGNSSHNLFNIKAGTGWTGKTISQATMELKNGNPVKEYAAFRQYDSYNESFKDYVALVRNSSRYHQALVNAAVAENYVSALQQAGYATDPDYAAKILQIANGETMAYVTPLLNSKPGV